MKGKSTVRDGWGILLNACSHLQDTTAIEFIKNHRMENFYGFSIGWGNHHYAIVEKE
jgi:hypothetical protein